MDAAIVELLPQAAGDLVAVEHQNHLGVGKGGPAAEGVHQPLPGGGQVPVRQGVELVPVEDDVVPVHHIVPLADLPQAGVRQRFPLFRSPVQGAADGAELPGHDGLQLRIVQPDAPAAGRGFLIPGLFQAAGQMHVFRHPVPLHGEPAAVGAEHGVGGVFQVRLRIVVRGGDHGIGVVAGSVPRRLQGQAAPAAGIGGHLLGVIVEFRHRDPAPQQGHVPGRLRSIEAAAAQAHITDGPAQLLRRHLQPEGVVRLQQAAPGLHQPLAHRPIGGLAEVAAFGMLDVGPAGHQRDLHIRNRGAGQDPQVGLFLQMGHDQPLPAPVQFVLGTAGGQHQAAALGQGLQQQVDLRIVAQGLVVAHALHRGVDGLLV